MGVFIVTTSHTAIDRRALITGRVLKTDRVIAPPGGEVETAIATMTGCEIYGRDAIGKLVVVVDAPDAGSLGTTLNTIALLPDVYSASLVFHAIDAS
jgi:nitrate reductase NapD